MCIISGIAARLKGPCVFYTALVAKRGYTRDTIRGGSSEWDVSRPFSSSGRLLAQLLVHPVRFFELLPKVPDLRAPGLFLGFCGLVSAVLWFVAAGWKAALVALVAPLPLCFALAALYHLASWGGRHGYRVTWRTVAYPLGFYLPLSAVPGVRWVGAAYAGVLLLAVGLATVREVGAVRAALASVAVAVAGVLIAGFYLFLAG